jgi:LmbE family N-acetylglucosaminyl deacetylase
MLIEDLRQIPDTYDHVYLSPHLDDAVLSCGGAIARHAATDARVLVVTLCTAAPLADGPFSAFARELHRLWGLGAGEVVAARLREDDMAIERLSADTFRAGLPDAIYRLPEVYDSNETLFGIPARGDPLLPAARELIAELWRRCPRAAFYAPLGVGNHVDHQIVHAAAREAAAEALAFYEDFPYVTRPQALEQRMAALGRAFVASTIDIDATLARKIAAIRAYTSQLSSLFDDPATLDRFVAEYAESLRPDVGTYGERVWINAER